MKERRDASKKNVVRGGRLGRQRPTRRFSRFFFKSFATTTVPSDDPRPRASRVHEQRARVFLDRRPRPERRARGIHIRAVAHEHHRARRRRAASVRNRPPAVARAPVMNQFFDDDSVVAFS